MSEGLRNGLHESKEHSAEDFGKNVHLCVVFRRHEEPGKTPEGMSADFLTEKGIAASKGRAKEVVAPVVKGKGSTIQRARETISYLLEAVPEESARVLNQRLTEQSKEHGAKGAPYKPQEGKEPFIVRGVKELDPLKNLAPLWKELGAQAKALKEAGDPRSAQDITWQLYLDTPSEKLREKEMPTQRETAAELAFILAHDLEMSGRLLNDSFVQLEYGTHGPKLEPFLREVGVRKGGNGEAIHGFKDIAEVGGSSNPGDAIAIDIQRSEKAQQPEVAINFHGIDFTVDMEAVRKLAEEHRQKTGKVRGRSKNLLKKNLLEAKS